MNARETVLQEATVEVRYRHQDALREAFKVSYLSFLGWNENTFTDQVITPSLFPEFFPVVEQSNVVAIWERDRQKIESIHDYRPELDYAFMCLESEGSASARSVYEVRTFLGWAAIGEDAQVLDFPIGRVGLPAVYPTGHNALIIYPFGV